MLNLTNCTIARTHAYRKGEVRGIFMEVDDPFISNLHAHLSAECGRHPDNHEIYSITPNGLNTPTSYGPNYSPIFIYFTYGRALFGTNTIDL